MFNLGSKLICLVSFVLLSSNFSQAAPTSDASSYPESEEVFFSVGSPTSKLEEWSFLIHKDSKVAQSYSVEPFNFYFEFDRTKNILKVRSTDPWEVQGSQEVFDITVMTSFPVEIEGRSNHHVTLVSAGVQVVGRWSSPSLTFIAAENFLLESHRYRIFPTGILEASFRNSGTIESKGLLRFIGHAEKKAYFLNSGRVVAPEIEVGSLFDRFYSFRNGDQKKGLINSKRFLGDIDYFSNSAEIHVTEQISVAGFDFNNQKGSLHSGGQFIADFDRVNNSEGSLSGRFKTELKIGENLDNQQGEIGSVSSTELTFHAGCQVENLGKIQGTEIALRSNQNEPLTLKKGELHGQKSVSIYSETKIHLPQVQIHTPLLNLSVPDFELDNQKDCGNTFVHCNPSENSGSGDRAVALITPYFSIS